MQLTLAFLPPLLELELLDVLELDVLELDVLELLEDVLASPELLLEDTVVSPELLLDTLWPVLPPLPVFPLPDDELLDVGFSPPNPPVLSGFSPVGAVYEQAANAAMAKHPKMRILFHAKAECM